ncbi:MAG: major capsid protein [Alistipes sp.]|nr:major capsid protein [Alistipes sp.]
MEKSLYGALVDKYFANLVLSITARLNDKAQDGLPYLYKQLLGTDYSTDGKWSTLTGAYTRVAADVVAMDSPLPLKKRDALAVAGGNIPKLGMELYLNENQMSEIDALLRMDKPNINAILRKVFGDTNRVIEGVFERMEGMFLQGFSTGVALADTDNVGTGIRVDYGYLDANKFGVKAKWEGNATTAKALDDIEKVKAKATADGNRIVKAYADPYFFSNIAENAQVRSQFAFNSGFVGTDVPILDDTQVSALMQRKFGFPVYKVDRAVLTEKNGVQTSHKYWQEGIIAFVCDEEIGSVVWTDLAEMNHPVAGVDYQTADEYILVSKYRDNRPALREYTASQARAIPVISNPDRIYTLDIKSVQA